MRYIVMVMGLLLLSGCGFKEAPVMQRYSIAVPPLKPLSDTQYRNKILKVSYPVGLGSVLNSSIYYSYTLTDSGSYLNACWSNDIGKLLQGNYIRVLSESGLFRVVVPFSSNMNENLRLESVVFDFSHHIRKDGSFAVVSIQFSLINAETGTLLKTKKFSYREPTLTTNARGYVEATNRIMAKLSRDLIEWLR
jgi:cholesterol transport system auxiliary component